MRLNNEELTKRDKRQGVKLFAIYYPNGNIIMEKAYTMELLDGKLYICKPAYPFDNGMPAIVKTQAYKVEEVDA